MQPAFSMALFSGIVVFLQINNSGLLDLLCVFLFATNCVHSGQLSARIVFLATFNTSRSHVTLNVDCFFWKREAE